MGFRSIYGIAFLLNLAACTVPLDSAPPVIALLAPSTNGALTNGPMDFIWSASDSGSGVDRVYTQADTDDWGLMFQAPVRLTTFAVITQRVTVTSNALTWKCYGIDRAGNIGITNIWSFNSASASFPWDSWLPNASNSVISVSNFSYDNLILFRETPDRTNILGKIPARSVGKIQFQIGLYLVKAVAESDFVSNTNDLLKANSVESRLVIIDGAPQNFSVDFKSFGASKVTVSNTLSEYIEIRKDSRDSDYWYFLPPFGSLASKIDEGSYRLYAYLLRMVSNGNSLEGVVKTELSDNARNVDTFIPATYSVDSTKESPAYAYLRVENLGGARFDVSSGGQRIKSTLNRNFLDTNKTEWYELKAQSNITGTYFSSFKLEDIQGNTPELKNFYLYPGDTIRLIISNATNAIFYIDGWVVSTNYTSNSMTMNWASFPGAAIYHFEFKMYGDTNLQSTNLYWPATNLFWNISNTNIESINIILSNNNVAGKTNL